MYQSVSLRFGLHTKPTAKSSSQNLPVFSPSGGTKCSEELTPNLSSNIFTGSILFKIFRQKKWRQGLQILKMSTYLFSWDASCVSTSGHFTPYSQHLFQLCWYQCGIEACNLLQQDPNHIVQDNVWIPAFLCSMKDDQNTSRTNFQFSSGDLVKSFGWFETRFLQSKKARAPPIPSFRLDENQSGLILIWKAAAVFSSEWMKPHDDWRGV